MQLTSEGSEGFPLHWPAWHDEIISFIFTLFRTVPGHDLNTHSPTSYSPYRTHSREIYIYINTHQANSPLPPESNNSNSSSSLSIFLFHTCVCFCLFIVCHLAASKYRWRAHKKSLRVISDSVVC